MILAGDVGATKILLEVGEMRSGKWQPALARRYVSAEAESFPAVLTAFLGEWNAVREKSQRITAAGFGVAGPVLGNKVKMTHRALTVDGDYVIRFIVSIVESNCWLGRICISSGQALADCRERWMLWLFWMWFHRLVARGHHIVKR